MKNRIICIGREFGSGGHEIAVKLGQRLGLRVYEKDLVRMACVFGDLSEKAMEAADEKATNPLLFQTIHEGNHHVTRGLPTSEVLFLLQSHEIRRLAEQESCIFVGRCADFVLKDADVSLLRVFVAASFDQRVRRKMEQEKLPVDRARRLVKRMDRRRKKYYENYTHQIWGAEENYDLRIDTSVTPVDRAVDLLETKYLTM